MAIAFSPVNNSSSPLFHVIRAQRGSSGAEQGSIFLHWAKFSQPDEILQLHMLGILIIGFSAILFLTYQVVFLLLLLVVGCALLRHLALSRKQWVCRLFCCKQQISVFLPCILLVVREFVLS